MHRSVLYEDQFQEFNILFEIIAYQERRQAASEQAAQASDKVEYFKLIKFWFPVDAERSCKDTVIIISCEDERYNIENNNVNNTENPKD